MKCSTILPSATWRLSGKLYKHKWTNCTRECFFTVTLNSYNYYIKNKNIFNQKSTFGAITRLFESVFRYTFWHSFSCCIWSKVSLGYWDCHNINWTFFPWLWLSITSKRISFIFQGYFPKFWRCYLIYITVTSVPKKYFFRSKTRIMYFGNRIECIIIVTK